MYIGFRLLASLYLTGLDFDSGGIQGPPRTLRDSKGLRMLTENPVCREKFWALSEGVCWEIQHLGFYDSTPAHSSVSGVASPLTDGETEAQQCQVILGLTTQSARSALILPKRSYFLHFLLFRNGW